MTNLNNWLSWSFNDIPYGLRTSKDDVYTLNINTSSITEPVKSYKEKIVPDYLENKKLYFIRKVDAQIKSIY
jgi:hypothetical protein